MAGPPRKLSIEDPFADAAAATLAGGAVLAPLPSGGDDYPMLQAFIVAAQLSSLRRLVLQIGTYRLSAPFTLPFGSVAVSVIGIPPTDSAGTILLATTPGARSVIDVLSAYSRFENLILDANRTANYGVYFEHATSTVFERVWVQGALLDGFHSSVVGINQGITLSQSRATGNGKTYATAGILAQYPANTVRQAVIAGTAATTAGNNTITFTGAPDLTTLGIRTGYNGDMVRVGAAATTSFYGQIFAVTVNTITLHNSTTAWPTATVAGADFAIGIGFGWYERVAATNGYNVLWNNSIFSGNGCGGIQVNALYGDGITDALSYSNNFTGVALGIISNDTLVSGATATKVYMEANVGPDWILGGIQSCKIDTPQGGSILSTGFFSIGGSVIGSTYEIIRDGSVEGTNGAPQNFLFEITNVAGTLKHNFLSDHFVPSGTNGATKINGATGALTTTPSVSNVIGFAAGAGILASTPEYLILDTTAAQSGSPQVSASIEINTAGTVYYAAVMPILTNINGVTKTRYALRLTDINGNLIQWSTVVIGVGKTISVRVNGLFR